MGSSRSNNKPFWIAFFVLLFFGLMAIVIWIGLSRPKTSIQEPTLSALIQSTAQVSMDHAVLVSMKTGQITEFLPGDVMVFVPIGATDVSGTISIINREPNMFPEAGEPGWTRPFIVNIEFMDKQGQPLNNFSFDKPLEICYGMTTEEWEKYSANKKDYRIETYDEGMNPPKWVNLKLLEYPTRDQLCGQTNHLSLFALAIKGILPPTETPTKLYEP